MGAEVAGVFGVGNLTAVDEPAHLVSAANVQLVVREISTGDVVGDHRETVGPRSAGRFLNLQAVDEAGRRNSLRLRSVGGDNYRFVLRGEAELEMQNRRTTREH